MLGVGTFRVYALSEVGEMIDYVTTLVVGDVDGDETDASASRPFTRPRPANHNHDPLRHALDTIATMAKAQSDALRFVSEAQADFVKGLATAKALPRNAPIVAAPPPALLAAADEDDEEEEEPLLG